MMGGYLTYVTLQFLPHGIGYPVGMHRRVHRHRRCSAALLEVTADPPALRTSTRYACWQPGASV